MPDRRPAAEPDRRPAAEPDSGRKAAVLGSPITHSRSPQLHLAAYRALGLPSWTYDRIECTAEQLPGVVSALGPEWVGLSVTMPGKFAALEFADQRTDRAQLVGSANTLVRMPSGGWRADNTDVDGVVGALGTAGDSALVIGSGGTAPAAVVALTELGVQRITIVARDEGKASRLVELAGRCGAQSSWCDIGTPALDDVVAAAETAVSTIPADAAAAYAHTLAAVPRVLDAIYDPWPTPLAEAVQAAGGEAINGLQMLLNQAFAQVEQFTGMAAPKEAMRAALG
ncbi:shikimate dehydrogenase [Mycolicibacterium sp. HK-90]|uniref:shikimate dehydrogenase n=1 Tax=Mycolicibacterium sp. HK-90 TaxID=3056937 RepID=UPI002659C581|nr:shikimate dehydrogenase [Mycolicibacterium sp. HK-90]WKG06136.1 shikimate dehydrogenase [Mycolicibacterium sp. HK-90]